MIKNSKWIIEEAPLEHKEMIFFSPDCRDISLYLKEISTTVILNDPLNRFGSILRILRDNDDLFFKKIKSINLNSKTFTIEKQKKTFKSDIEKALNNYILSRYNKNNKKFIDELKDLSLNMNKNSTFIYNYNTIDSLKKFNSENLFIYYSPTIKDINQKDHSNILDVLFKHYSKIIIHAYDNKLYKKYFKDWNKKKKPNQKIKTKIECIWKNF
jgi:hypothetical protein